MPCSRHLCALILIATLGQAFGCVANEPVRPADTKAFAEPTAIVGVDNFSRVAPGLYRGAQPTAEGFRELERRGVRTVVNLRQFNDDADLLVGTSLKYVHIPCSAWGIDRDVLRRFLAVMNDPANQPVFVHCQHGADRTGFVVGGYRIDRLGWDGRSAVTELYAFGHHRIWFHIPWALRRMGGKPGAERATSAAVSVGTAG